MTYINKPGICKHTPHTPPHYRIHIYNMFSWGANCWEDSFTVCVFYGLTSFILKIYFCLWAN